MRKFTEEEINSGKRLAKKYGFGFSVDTYAGYHALLFYDKDMDLDDKNRKTPYRNEKGNYCSEIKYFIFRTNKRIYKYHIGFLYWNDQIYQSLWKPGENGFWACMSLFGGEETFKSALYAIKHSLEKKCNYRGLLAKLVNAPNS